MNFCQKHQNHHCIHAHQCKNPQHQKHIQKKSLQQHNKTLANIQERKKTNQNCTFTKNSSHKLSKQANQQLLKLLHEKQIKICELSHDESALRQKHDKLLQENRHLYSQIEYYRQQFASLIENSTQDNKNEIKKRIKQTTNFALKLSSLQNQNQSLRLQNGKLKSQLEAERTSKSQNRQINENMEDRLHEIHTKLRAVDRQKQEYRDQMTGKAKQYERLKENYDILKKQCANECQKSKRSIKQLTLQLESTKKQLTKLRNTSEKERQLLNIQIKNLQKRQQALKDKLSLFESNNKELFDSIKQLKDKNQELQQNLYHAKKIIDKNQQNTHEFINLQKELNEKNIETNTLIKEHHPSFSSANKQNKHSLKDNEEIEALQQEIKSLKQKIVQLEKRSMTNYEEIIMNMGASEAFRKLLEEKNATIKKLMREKGEIYAKMTIIHQH